MPEPHPLDGPPPEPQFRPFADDAAVRTVGGLSIENGTTRIAIHGSAEITRDRAGLARARALRDALEAMIAALDLADLPEAVSEETRPAGRTENPFA